MKNFVFTAIGGVLALVIFVLGLLFGEFVNVVKSGSNAANSVNAEQNSTKQLSLNEQIEYSIKAKPDLYKANPSFYADGLSDENKSIINARFAGILSLVKENGLCSGGAYETFTERAQNGQTSLNLRSSLACEFKESELGKYNELISSIEDLIKASPVKLHLAKVNPTFSDAQKAKNKELLKEGLLKKSLENAQFLSKNLGKNCELSSVDLGFSHYANASFDGTRAVVAAPALSEQTLAGNAAANYICK